MRALLLLAFLLATPAARAQPADWSAAQTVTVVTTEYHFAPDRLTFRRGVPYRLHLENPGHEMHEFTAGDFFKAIQMRNPEVIAAVGPEIVLKPGEQKDLFFVARQTGHYKLICSDHDWAGMVSEITV